MPTLAPAATSSAPIGSTPAPVQAAPAATPAVSSASGVPSVAPVAPIAPSGAVGAVSPTSTVPGAPAGVKANPAANVPSAQPITPEYKIVQPGSGVPSTAPAPSASATPTTPSASTPSATPAAPAAAAPAMDKNTQIAYQNRIKQLQDTGLDIKTAQAQANADLVKSGQSARPYEIWSNLAEGQKNTPNAFKDRSTFDTAYGYAQKNAQEKSVMDAFWNATAPKTTSDLLVKLANGETLGNTPQEQNATRYFSMINSLAQKGPDALKGAVDMGLISPGSQAWNILAAKNPQLAGQYEQASKNEQILSNINENAKRTYNNATAASGSAKVKATSASANKVVAPTTADEHVQKAGENITSALIKQNPELESKPAFDQLSSSLTSDPAVQNIQSQMRDAFTQKAKLQADIRTLESDTRLELKKHGVEGPVADAYVAAKTQTLNLQLQPLIENMNFLQGQLSYITDNHWKEVQTNIQQQGLDLQKNQQAFNQTMALNNYSLDTAKYETSIKQFNATQQQQVNLAKLGYSQQEKMAEITTANQQKVAEFQAQLDKQKINSEIITDPMTGRMFAVNKNTGEQIGGDLVKGYTEGGANSEFLNLKTYIEQTNKGMSSPKAAQRASERLASGKDIDQFRSDNKTSTEQSLFKATLGQVQNFQKVHTNAIKVVQTGLLTTTPYIQDALQNGKSTVYSPAYKTLADELSKALAGGASSEGMRDGMQSAGISNFEGFQQTVSHLATAQSAPIDAVIQMAKFAKGYLNANNEAYAKNVNNLLGGVDNPYDLEKIKSTAGSDYINRSGDNGDAAGTLKEVQLGKGYEIPSDIITKYGEGDIKFVPTQTKQEIYLLNNEEAAKQYAAHPKTYTQNESVFKNMISQGYSKNQVSKSMRDNGMYDTYAYLLWY